MTLTENARAYVAKMPPSISGSGGRTALFNVAAVLTRGFCLGEDEALDILRAWNDSNSVPPWNERELRAKLREGSRAKRASGYLLGDREANPRLSVVSDHRADDRKRALRALWPKFHPLSSGSLEAIAQLRGLPLSAVHAADALGFLAGAVVDGHRCFVIREDTFAQARRFDGECLPLSDGRTTKAKNLPGSKGVFIGRRMLGDARNVLLVEGAVALLEATAVVLAGGAEVSWAAAAATSASSRFDERWLCRLKGRHVRIVPDEDKAGLDACGIWAAQLRRAGIQVDALRPPAACKDIGPVAKDPDAHCDFISQLFAAPIR